MTEALEHFGDRLGLEEARAFATLIQQSAELGSSITEALRVYSDDMRHKRLSRAEEKAYSLGYHLTREGLRIEILVWYRDGSVARVSR